MLPQIRFTESANMTFRNRLAPRRDTACATEVILWPRLYRAEFAIPKILPAVNASCSIKLPTVASESLSSLTEMFASNSLRIGEKGGSFSSEDCTRLRAGLQTVGEAAETGLSIYPLIVLKAVIL